MKVFIRTMQLTLAVSLFWCGRSSAVLAQIDRVRFAAPPPPSGIGAPGQRSDAGSRPQSCQQAQKPLTAIVPVYPSKEAEIVWGTATTEQPTLWFYVPYSSKAAVGEFVLETINQQQTIIKVPLAETSGFLKVSLADHKASLEAGKPYRWYFNIYCRNSDEVESYVEGSITRQPLNVMVQNQLTQAQLSKRVELLAANGVWYDALTIAAGLKCARSNDPHWTSLLQAVGLRELAQESMVSCHALKK